MKFDTQYRRALHAQLDRLLDADEKIYVGPAQFLDKATLADRVSKKWAFDELIRAQSKAQYGKDEVVRSLRTSIETCNTVITKSDDETLIESFKLTIETIENFISELDK